MPSERIPVDLGMVSRHGLVAVLLAGGFLLSIETHLYATALLASSLGVFLLLSTSKRSTPNVERTTIEPPSRADYLQSLLDTVNVSLMVLDDSNRLTLANRTAQRLVAEPVRRLAQISWLGESASAHIERLPAGQSKVVVCSDGQSAFVTASEFRASGRAPQRLIALQRLAGDLDAVELQAWRDLMRLLAHEIMNSLAPIASLAETLNDSSQTWSQGASEEASLAIEAIARRSRGLLDFVHRYREASEIPQPKIEDIDTDVFISRLNNLLRATSENRHVRLETNFDAGHRFAADPVLIEQALVNLIMNALDAVHGNSEPHVVLELRTLVNGVRLAVIDNGAGVSPKDRTQLFVPFFTTKQGGSGIGLSLARNIALAHGGQLSYEPNEPKGSRFTITLPSACRT